MAGLAKIAGCILRRQTPPPPPKLWLGGGDGKSINVLKFWEVLYPSLAGVAHDFCTWWNLLQEDINLRELEDKYWLCDAGADRHGRQVSKKRSLVPSQSQGGSHR